MEICEAISRLPNASKHRGIAHTPKMTDPQVVIESGIGSEADSRTKWWTFDAVKAKVVEHCLWTVCRAMTIGVLLIVIGAGMATVGFYSDHLSTVEEQRGNTTIWVKNESTDMHLGSLTYIGPAVMGAGGFIIVAACVMTFEARDTASKIVPVWFRKGRIHAAMSTAASSRRSSQTSWERFLARSKRKKAKRESRTAVTQALIDFSIQLQQNVDAKKTSAASKVLRKCPSEPAMVAQHRFIESNSDAKKAQTSSTPQPSTSPRNSCLLAPPPLKRQAISVDSPGQCEALTVPAEEPCKESTQSLSVDVYLPQGTSLTLKVRDEGRESKANTDNEESSSLLTVPKSSPTGSQKRHPLLRQTALDTCNEDESSDDSS